MSQELLSSKIVVVEEAPAVRGIAAAPTSIAAAIGIAERGPVDTPVLCSTFDEYQAHYGGFTPDSDLALAAMGFFENGGTQLWCVRTVHHADVLDAGSATALRASAHLTSFGVPAPARVTGTLAAPFILDDGAQLVVSVAGGADASVAIKATAASVSAASAGPYALADGQTLQVRIDGVGVQTITFAAPDFAAIAKATPTELIASVNAKIVGAKAVLAAGVPSIASDTKGTSSQVEILGGTALGPLGFATTPALGAGNVARVRAVTIAEVSALAAASLPSVIVSAAPGGLLDIRTVAVGAAATVQVRATTAAGFGLDTTLHAGSASGAANAVLVEGLDPGAYANTVQAEIRVATSGAPASFNLAVVEDGSYRELFPNLDLNPASARHIERIVNDAKTGSSLIRVTDQRLGGAPTLPPQLAALSGGDDGLDGFGDTDLVGNALGRTGLHALDRIADIALLLVPGHATPAVQNAMISYCEIDRDGTMFAVLDPPAGMSATDIITYVESTAALENLSEFGAIYWPRVKVLNPDKTVFGTDDTIVVPPSGIIAGAYARTDAARPGGVYDPPAGTEAGKLLGVLGFETDEVLEERKRDLVYPKRINPLTTGPGLPRYIDGSRTLKGDGNFPYVAERRGVIFIERSLKVGLQFARHKNNTEALRSTVRRTITTFLFIQMNNGAFRSTTPATAYFVDVSDLLNTAAVVMAGQLLARIGLATNKPAEFIVLKIAQDTRALDAMLAAAGG
jgi:phage tail sheath protein FI